MWKLSTSASILLMVLTIALLISMSQTVCMSILFRVNTGVCCVVVYMVENYKHSWSLVLQSSLKFLCFIHWIELGLLSFKEANKLLRPATAGLGGEGKVDTPKHDILDMLSVMVFPLDRALVSSKKVCSIFVF